VRKIVFGLALWALVVAAPGVRAQPQFDFGVPATATGTISYGGGLSPLIGSGITVNEVAGKNVPMNNFVGLAVSGGSLSFTTGGQSGGPWHWGSGGSLTISGTISPQTPPGGSPFTTTTSGPLLTGTLVSAVITPGPGSNTFLVAIGAFLDTANSAILSYYGLSSAPAPSQGNFAISFFVSGGATPGQGFTSTTMGSGDVTTSPVPAPGFLVLFCSGGAVGLLGYAWRRARAVAAGGLQ
jgi:hypothetical protein